MSVKNDRDDFEFEQFLKQNRPLPLHQEKGDELREKIWLKIVDERPSSFLLRVSF